jgi:hypothetical protein
MGHHWRRFPDIVGLARELVERVVGQQSDCKKSPVGRTHGGIRERLRPASAWVSFGIIAGTGLLT